MSELCGFNSVHETINCFLSFMDGIVFSSPIEYVIVGRASNLQAVDVPISDDKVDQQYLGMATALPKVVIDVNVGC